MRYSRALIPTLKEAPSDATTVSHVLLTRAGYVRRVGAGIYSFLPLGLRVLSRIESIVREEMDAAGALEVLLPALLPAEYFRETGRWDRFERHSVPAQGSQRRGLPPRSDARRDHHASRAPQHQELPRSFFRRICTRFKPKYPRRAATLARGAPSVSRVLDERRLFVRRERSGGRIRELRVDAKGVHEHLRSPRGSTTAWCRPTRARWAAPTSAEFQVLVQSGEDIVAACSQCNYAANLEVATAGAAPAPAIRQPRSAPAMMKVRDIPGSRAPSKKCRAS